MRYYIIAGERSGDLHGGNLVKSLKKRDAASSFRGFGGQYMAGAGVDIVVDYSQMAFMGFTAIFTNFSKIAGFIKQCKSDILEYKPDAIILIDYGGFNRRIAAFCKKHGIKVFYYIPPKVWAWGQYRARQLKASTDRMFVILPFEKEFFKRFDYDVDYVGNPVLDAVKAHQPDPEFLKHHGLGQKGATIALLPGSRKSELAGILPLMKEVAQRFPQNEFVVAAVNNLDRSLYDGIEGLPNVKLVFEDTYNLLLNAKAAIVTSGTATLETGLFNVPQIVVYRANAISYWVARWVIQVPYISLINLIAGREVVKEMIQGDANADAVSKELDLILNDKVHRQNILTGYDEIVRVLDIGSASENTAELMVKYLN